MRDRKECYDIIRQIDGSDFSDYGMLVGDYDFTRFILKISDVPVSAEDNKTMFVVAVPQHVAAFPVSLYNTPIRRTALEDVLARKVAHQVSMLAQFDASGMASQRLTIPVPSAQILPRSVLSVSDEYVELRIQANLPNLAGKIHGEALCDIFFQDLAHIIDSALLYCNLDQNEIKKAISLMEEADQIRQILTSQGLVSIVADDTFISSDDEEGSEYDITVDPDTRVTLNVPDHDTISGLGIPAGITVILGAGNQGRSELLQIIASGIYNHAEGDGREYCITVPDAVYIAAAPGRSVQNVDLRPFVTKPTGELGLTTSTASADAFTSQAASTMEALVAGARVLVFDEVDSAPGFLSCDNRLTSLIPELQAEYLPLAARAREIVDTLGVSLIVGGASSVVDLIPLATTVLLVEDGKVSNITQKALSTFSSPAPSATPIDLSAIVEQPRWIVPSSIDPSEGFYDVLTKSISIDRLRFGRLDVDLSDVIQIADQCQTETIGLILQYAKQRYLDHSRPLREVLDLVDRDLSTEGLECLTRETRSDMARPRRYEISAALNRLRSLRITDTTD